MSAPEIITTRIENAEGAAPTLAACWDGFEFVRQIASAYAQQGSDLYYSFTFVIPPACEGRDSLGFAPSMPQGPATVSAPLGPDCPDPDHVADSLAALAAVMNRKLASAVTDTSQPRDREAFMAAAAAAAEIRDLLSGVWTP